jgi:hypothetical protein
LACASFRCVRQGLNEHGQRSALTRPRLSQETQGATSRNVGELNEVTDLSTQITVDREHAILVESDPAGIRHRKALHFDREPPHHANQYLSSVGGITATHRLVASGTQHKPG